SEHTEVLPQRAVLRSDVDQPVSSGTVTLGGVDDRAVHLRSGDQIALVTERAGREALATVCAFGHRAGELTGLLALLTLAAAPDRVQAAVNRLGDAYLGEVVRVHGHGRGCARGPGL